MSQSKTLSPNDSLVMHGRETMYLHMVLVVGEDSRLSTTISSSMLSMESGFRCILSVSRAGEATCVVQEVSIH